MESELTVAILSIMHIVVTGEGLVSTTGSSSNIACTVVRTHDPVGTFTGSSPFHIQALASKWGFPFSSVWSWVFLGAAP